MTEHNCGRTFSNYYDNLSFYPMVITENTHSISKKQATFIFMITLADQDQNSHFCC